MAPFSSAAAHGQSYESTMKNDDTGSIGSDTFREQRRRAYETNCETDEQLFNTHNITSIYDNTHHNIDLDDDLNSAGSSLGGYESLGETGSKASIRTREELKLSLIARRRRLAQMENAMEGDGSVDFSLRLNRQRNMDAGSLVSSLRDSIVSLNDSLQGSLWKKQKKSKDKKKKSKKKSSSKDKDRKKRKEKEKEREKKKSSKHRHKEKEKEKSSSRHKSKKSDKKEDKKKKLSKKYDSSDSSSSESDSDDDYSRQQHNHRQKDNIDRSGRSGKSNRKGDNGRNAKAMMAKGGKSMRKSKQMTTQEHQQPPPAALSPSSSNVVYYACDENTGMCAFHPDVQLRKKSRFGGWNDILKQCPKCAAEANSKHQGPRKRMPGGGGSVMDRSHRSGRSAIDRSRRSDAGGVPRSPGRASRVSQRPPPDNRRKKIRSDSSSSSSSSSSVGRAKKQRAQQPPPNNNQRHSTNRRGDPRHQQNGGGSRRVSNDPRDTSQQPPRSHMSRQSSQHGASQPPQRGGVHPPSSRSSRHVKDNRQQQPPPSSSSSHRSSYRDPHGPTSNGRDHTTGARSKSRRPGRDRVISEQPAQRSLSRVSDKVDFDPPNAMHNNSSGRELRYSVGNIDEPPVPRQDEPSYSNSGVQKMKSKTFHGMPPPSASVEPRRRASMPSNVEGISPDVIRNFILAESAHFDQPPPENLEGLERALMEQVARLSIGSGEGDLSVSDLENNSKFSVLREVVKSYMSGEISNNNSNGRYDNEGGGGGRPQENNNSHGYKIGDEGRRRDMIKDDDKDVALMRIASLQPDDPAFIRRTTGNWTFAKVKNVSSDSIVFIANENGSSKAYNVKYWVSHIRTLKSPGNK